MAHKSWRVVKPQHNKKKKKKKNRSLLTLITINSVFKHSSLKHADAYNSEYKHTKPKKTLIFWRNKILIIPSTISAEEYSEE